jgi:TatD DNase family protein
VIDSHCHLADDAFVRDLDDVVGRARHAGLTYVLCVLAAENTIEIERARNLRTIWPGVRFAIGVHPHQAGQFAGGELKVERLVRDAIAAFPHARAVGEIGLDYHYDFAPRRDQHAVFRAQIRLARRLDLPIVIHTRDAEEDTLTILREEAGDAVHGVMHCFTGTRRLADEAIALGMHISFAGIITFPKAGELREIASQIPLDRLLCETDSPYLAPTPYRGKRNEPAWVVRVAHELAALRGMADADLRTQLDANFSALFRP